MHCNLRPPDVVLVVLRFNYESHNAPEYKFSSSAKDTWATVEHLSVLCDQICTAHAQKLLFLSFQSKF